jgi:ketosteroid isomerase-like protein
LRFGLNTYEKEEKTMITRIGTLNAAILALTLLLAMRTGEAGDRAADAQRIRELGVAWVAAVGAKDIAAIQNFYTTDALFMAPNAPPAQGRQAIGEVWRGLLQLPGIVMTFGATRIEVSESGDLAYDVGAYALGFDSESGRVNDNGKYVVVWKKVEGTWKAVADIFNSNLPAN